MTKIQDKNSTTNIPCHNSDKGLMQELSTYNIKPHAGKSKEVNVPESVSQNCLDYNNVNPNLISIAPMLDWTDRHFRYFLRKICHQPMFYTEMIACPALILGDREKLLAYSPEEHPLTLQVGGSEPHLMAMCAKFAQEAGYKAININAGCPSSRVQAGKFGAILMQTPGLVADCVAKMKATVRIPVTVKTRISLYGTGTDGYAELFHFTDLVKKAGCDGLIVHARQAKLNLSPKDNRDKLPLNYDVVYRLKKSFPDLFISINGNIKTLEEMAYHLGMSTTESTSVAQTPYTPFVDGVMVGRVAYGNPYIMAQIDRLFFKDNHPILSRCEVLESMIPYLEHQGNNLKNVTRHMLGLYHGRPNAKAYKQAMMSADIQIIRQFLKEAPLDN